MSLNSWTILLTVYYQHVFNENSNYPLPVLFSEKSQSFSLNADIFFIYSTGLLGSNMCNSFGYYSYNHNPIRKRWEVNHVHCTLHIHLTTHTSFLSSLIKSSSLTGQLSLPSNIALCTHADFNPFFSPNLSWLIEALNHWT